MLDVLVVAILVVFLRVQALGGGMSMRAELGIYCFGASVLCAMWAGERIDRTEPRRATLPVGERPSLSEDFA